MEILYIAPNNDLAELFFQGWKNAFEALGHSVTRLEPNMAIGWLEKHPVDMIFTHSGEGVLSLDPRLINQRQTKVVVGALPANRWNVSFDPHTPLANPSELKVLRLLDQLVLWSQHEPFLYPFFYQSYLDQGIKVVYLPYAADITLLQPLDFVENPAKDLIFIGNLAHRKRGNLRLLAHLLSQLDPRRVEIYGDDLWGEHFGIPARPFRIDHTWPSKFAQAAIAPNLHTHRQKSRMIQVNNRTFDIPLYGGFQITDHPLAAKFFDPTEICIAPSPREFLDQFFEFLHRPDLRESQIKAAQLKLRKEHSYFNRLSSIFEAFELSAQLHYGGLDYSPTRFNPGSERFIPNVHLAYWSMEDQAFGLLRKLKQRIPWV